MEFLSWLLDELFGNGDNTTTPEDLPNQRATVDPVG